MPRLFLWGENAALARRSQSAFLDDRRALSELVELPGKLGFLRLCLYFWVFHGLDGLQDRLDLIVVQPKRLLLRHCVEATAWHTNGPASWRSLGILLWICPGKECLSQNSLSFWPNPSLPQTSPGALPLVGLSEMCSSVKQIIDIFIYTLN